MFSMKAIEFTGKEQTVNGIVDMQEELIGIGVANPTVVVIAYKTHMTGICTDNPKGPEMKRYLLLSAIALVVSLSALLPNPIYGHQSGGRLRDGDCCGTWGDRQCPNTSEDNCEYQACLLQRPNSRECTDMTNRPCWNSSCDWDGTRSQTCN